MLECLEHHRRIRRGLRSDYLGEQDAAIITHALRTSAGNESSDVFHGYSFATRRLCLTKKGYIGQLPHSAAVDDLICIFLGSCVPHVLRMMDDKTFQVVGDAHVHGVMQGEVMRQGGIRIQDLILC